MTEKLEVGAYEAKTHLPELLRKVKAGQCFTITQRGQAVADLVPTGAGGVAAGSAAAQRMQVFMVTARTAARVGAPVVDVKAMMAEGRD